MNLVERILSGCGILKAFEDEINISAAKQGIPADDKNKESSKYVGVYWSKEKQMWRAVITKDYKPIHICYKHKEKDAAAAYNKKARELYGKHAHLNKIDK